jgi:pyruvate dehydrogenase E1 component alpha subunit
MMGDPEIYRSKDEVIKAREIEPIVRLEKRLLNLGYTQYELKKWENEASEVIDLAVSFAESSPAPIPTDALSDIFA